jgi:hypothetical protein
LLEKKNRVIYYIRSFAEESILVDLNFNDDKINVKIGNYLTSNSECLLSNKRNHLNLKDLIMLLTYEALNLGGSLRAVKENLCQNMRHVIRRIPTSSAAFQS